MAVSGGVSFLDSETRRNQEWLRRRKLRLEQVRKQSNEIAKALREKIVNHEKERLQEYERMSETKLQCWKSEKLDELEKKLMCALEDFGEGYKEAEEEPDPDAILEELHKTNLIKAQNRGEIARQEELKRRKIAEENKMAPIERKKLIRKKEDLRSALVLSLPAKKQLLEKQTACEEKVHPEKLPSTPVKHKIMGKDPKITGLKNEIHPNKTRKKKVPPAKCCTCKKKGKLPETHNNIWINLNDLQNSTRSNSGLQRKLSKSTEGTEMNQKEKPEGVVEFYDFSSRYYCKSFKEYPHLVERIDPGSEVLSAHAMAEKENEKEKALTRKKVRANAVSQERGMEALRREKISQDYNNLITKLEELNRKEKMLKAQQRNLPSFLHMNDERLHERLKTKQRMMDSKFENICYEAISQVPRPPPPKPAVLRQDGGGDYDGGGRVLGFSSERLRTNTPRTTGGESSEEPPEERTFWEKPKRIEKRTQLIMDIDKTLREGRELRKAVSKTRDSTSAVGKEGKEEENLDAGSEEAGETKTALPTPREDEKTTKCQESQTDDLQGDSGVAKPPDSNPFVMSGDDSLPVSTATSYKGPPSVIRSYRLHQFLEYFDGINETRGNILLEGYSDFCKRTHESPKDSFKNRSTKSGEPEGGRQSPTLEYYIEKLLDMSRERIADLSVSSEYISTPNITDLDTRKSKTSDHGNSCSVSSRGEELVRKSRLERADHLGKTIKNWKRRFEKNSKDEHEAEDVPDGPRGESVRGGEMNGEECGGAISNPKIMRKYEEITKKCSERISELSIMLDKVRKDKKELLSSTSGRSSLSSTKDGENSEEEEAVVPMQKEKRVDDFFNRHSQSTCGKEALSTVAVADSQSLGDLEDSLESWPDVMDELLKRKILTSPFKWSDVESSEVTTLSCNKTKPSSIDTVIGNFRREIGKIKPFTVSDPFPQMVASVKSPYFEEKYRALLDNTIEKDCCDWPTMESGKPFQEGSSVESINHALTTLGLNWAKSFLRKNEESKAMSSSSNSEGETSGNEADFR